MNQPTIILNDSLYQLLKPILTICKIFCLLPFETKKHGAQWWIFWSWRSLSTVVLRVVLIGSYSIYGFSMNYQLPEIHKIRLDKFSSMFITISDVTTLVLTFLSCTCSSILNFRYLQKYFFNLSKVDVATTFHPTTLEARKYSKLILVSSLTILLILTADLFIWSTIATKNTNLLLYILYQLPFCFYHVLLVVIAIYYNILVRCIFVRLKFLNNQLAKEYFLRGDFYTSLYKMKEPRLSACSCSMNERTSVSIISPIINREKRINYLEGYDFLVQSNSALNKYFGFTILVIMFGILMHLLVTPYDLYVELLNQKYWFLFLQILWMIGHILRLLLIIEPCNTTEKQVKKMFQAVCKLLTLKIDEEFREQLNILLSQMNHCPIKFTCCDMISLDRHLITSLAAAVTTYLVILYQFSN